MTRNCSSAALAILFLLGIGGALGSPAAQGRATTAPGQKDSHAIRAARQAVDELDYDRIWTDQPYAQSMLQHLDALAPLAAADPSRAAALDAFRALFLAALDRLQESRLAVDRVLASGVAEPETYTLSWAAASIIHDPDLMLSTLETMAKRVSPASRSEVYAVLTPAVVGPLYRHFRAKKMDAQRDRLVDAMVEMNWPGDTDPGSRDAFRKALLDRRLSQGDRGGAKAIASTIVAPDSYLPLMVMRKYNGLLDHKDDPTVRFQELLTGFDRQTAAALAADPKNFQRVLDRAQFLRSLGRETEAVSILTPFTADVAATHAQDVQGMWLMNEAAYALIGLGRNEEALRLMSQLVKMDMAENPDLIGPSINYAEMLWEAGRPAESLAHVAHLKTVEEHANAYGQMWIMSSFVCSLQSLGRTEEAAAQARLMDGRRSDNPAAFTRALLCTGNLDRAERLMVERLESEEPYGMVLALQDYQAPKAKGGAGQAIYDRLLQLRERAAVRAALERVGRVLPLPLARSYYGGV